MGKNWKHFKSRAKRAGGWSPWQEVVVAVVAAIIGYHVLNYDVARENAVIAIVVGLGAAAAWQALRFTYRFLWAVPVELEEERDKAVAQLDDRQKKKDAREAVGRLVEQLAHCELQAYGGSTGKEYDDLMDEIKELKSYVHLIATKYLDGSFESRFLAVNVLDVQLDEPTRLHFITRAQGSFWTVYQNIKGWRICVREILVELNDR